MKKAKAVKNRDRKSVVPSVGEYLQMSDREKDIEIQQAVARLQRRIQSILSMIDSDAARQSRLKQAQRLPKLP